MVLSDALDRVVAVNAAFGKLVQCDPAEVLGQPAELLGVAPLRAAHMSGIDVALRKGLPWSGDSAIIGAGGQTHDLWLGVSTVRDAERRITHHWRVFQDVRPLKDHILHLAEQARLDSLTGLPNRRSFGERLFRAMARARRYPRTLAIMCVDLDGFKSVNDNHGHQVGDELLVQVSRRLEACVRTTDSVCRMGGDEFMLILEGAGSAHEIERIGQRVLRCLTEGYAILGKHLHITPSIGAVVHDGNESDTELVQRADAAMYSAKHAGKCRLVLVSAPESADISDAPAPSAEPGPLLSLISSHNSNDKNPPAEGAGGPNKSGNADNFGNADSASPASQTPSHAA
jgi:diguanylate cyclase (GGDEF)-like protein